VCAHLPWRSCWIFRRRRVEPLRDRRYPNNDDLQNGVLELVLSTVKDRFAATMRKLPEGWQRCSDLGEEVCVLKYGCVAAIISRPVFQAFDAANVHSNVLRNALWHQYEAVLYLVHGFRYKNCQFLPYDVQQFCYKRSRTPVIRYATQIRTHQSQHQKRSFSG
jgi:hypothetical protein